jgi:hypothetical protein
LRRTELMLLGLH